MGEMSRFPPFARQRSIGSIRPKADVCDAGVVPLGGGRGRACASPLPSPVNTEYTPLARVPEAVLHLESTLNPAPGSRLTRIALGLLASLSIACGTAQGAVHIDGEVQAGGGAVAGSTVSLWAATANAPARLAQARAGADGRFVVSAGQAPDGAILYLVATGGTPLVNKQGGNNPTIALLSVLGSKPPALVVVNELTTVASVWTNAQFLDGTAIKGPALSLRIAAGNVPNFVDLTTGGLGTVIQDFVE